MIDHLSMMAALRGRRSQIWMPGTFVGIAPKAPRYSDGASGFGSHVSCWLGPPRIQRMITDFSREIFCEGTEACARSRPEKLRPAKPRNPLLIKLRRSIASNSLNSGQPMRLALAWLDIASIIADESV